MVYYAETNIIAIAVGAILLFMGTKVSSKNETSQMIMSVMLLLLELVGFSDIFAYYFRGKSYMGVEVSNLLYFVAFDLGTYAWFLFILVKMGFSGNLKYTILKTGAPALLLAVAILLNPFTDYFFTVDEQFLYHRGSGVLLTWIVEWGYMLAALGINIRSVSKEKRIYRKREFQGYLIFTIPVAVAAVCQMVFYGTTTTQIGYMLALLMVFLNNQHYQVQRDELTGLNNRNAFLNYQDSLLSRSGEHNLTLFMMDMDNFKSINDTYGHMMGDQALKDMSNVLKAAVDTTSQNRVMLFRYGGDEFIIVGRNMEENGIRQIQDTIEQQLRIMNTENQEKGSKYTLSVSIGTASKVCETLADFEELIKSADQEMYRVKAVKKKACK